MTWFQVDFFLCDVHHKRVCGAGAIYKDFFFFQRQFVDAKNLQRQLAASLTIQNDCGTDFCECAPVSEDVAREQARARSSETKLTEAMSELKRMRESNAKYDASAKEYKAQCIGALGTHNVM